MKHLPPLPWHAIQPGAVVLTSDGVPRTVRVNVASGHDRRVVLLEGLAAPELVGYDWPAYPVELDEADAICTLFAAGFTIEPIEE